MSRNGLAGLLGAQASRLLVPFVPSLVLAGMSRRDACAPSSSGSRRLWFLGLAALLTLTGCGYRPASATRSLKGQSIAVEPLVNKTTTFEVEQVLTRALVRSLVEKSSYRVVEDPSKADVVLRGEILSVLATPVIYGRETFGSAFLVNLNAKVELKDRRTGKLLFKNDSYLFREEYEINADVKYFFSESNPALERIAADFGSSVVSTVLEDF